MINQNPNLSFLGTFTVTSDALGFYKKVVVHIAIVDLEIQMIIRFKFNSLFDKRISTIMNATQDKFDLDSFNHGCNYFLLKPLTRIGFCGL